MYSTKMTYDKLFEAIEAIKNDENIFICKLDGERKEKNYMSIITFSKKNQDMIRHDANSMKEAIVLSLNHYFQMKESGVPPQEHAD